MISDSTRRAMRTGIDAVFTTVVALAAMLAYPGLPELLDAALGRQGATAAIVVVCGAILVFCSKLRNALEDRGTIPALLKVTPSPGANPVPDEDGVTAFEVVVVVCLVILVLIGLGFIHR